MSEMGKYCKAYLVKRFREFSGWQENVHNLRKETKVEEGVETVVEKMQLQDEDVLYLQENYVVTDGIFKDEHIVFDKVDDTWKKFCKEVLKFEIPVYEASLPTQETIH